MGRRCGPVWDGMGGLGLCRNFTRSPTLQNHRTLTVIGSEASRPNRRLLPGVVHLPASEGGPMAELTRYVFTATREFELWAEDFETAVKVFDQMLEVSGVYIDDALTDAAGDLGLYAWENDHHVYSYDPEGS